MNINDYETRNGLLYAKGVTDDKDFFGALMADKIAREFGFMYAEGLVEFLETKQSLSEEWGSMIKADKNDNRLWNKFCKWASDTSIGTHVDDYADWWECYQQGAKDFLTL